jgi:hypothetical protein
MVSLEQKNEQEQLQSIYNKLASMFVFSKWQHALMRNYNITAFDK